MIKYKKILLVDDDIDDQLIFGEILCEMDDDSLLVCAENGLEMVALLDRTKEEELPDMIILDQNMPKMTGKESLIFLKENPRYQAIPTIIYSTFQVEDFYHECLLLGAQDVVPKPDSLQAYREMIEQFLATRSHPLFHPPDTHRKNINAFGSRYK
jgi:CheY-like chemotaxis protein